MDWASNWRHPSGQDNPPDETMLTGALPEWLGDAATRHRILVKNPATLYGLNETIGEGRS
jgi:predicted TIM-barrel fold metal-dependent hydrolase